MTRCIYCKRKTVPREERVGPLNPSREHVIPYSLGGSDGLSTPDACAGCNNTLGGSVDNDCINQPYIVMLRQQFRIEGQRGTVPDLVLPARSIDGNEPAIMTIPHGGPAKFKHKPIVIRQQETFGEQVLVVGDDMDVTKIVIGIASKAEKHGDQVIDPKTGVALDIAASIAAAPREHFSEYQVNFPIDNTALRREIVKIAFGFAHLIFGWRWTDSSRARRMRAIVKGGGTPGDVDALITGVDTQIRTVLPMGSAGADDHFIALMPMGVETQIIVSLFSQALLTAAVRLDIDRATLEAGVAEHDRVMATVDHQTRRTTWVNLVAFTEHMAQSSAKPEAAQ